MEFTDTSLMPFGLHKDKKMINVPAHYLLWLYETNKCSGELKEYIIDNLDVLKEEMRRFKKQTEPEEE